MIYIFEAVFGYMSHNLPTIQVSAEGEDCNKAKEMMIKRLPKGIEVVEIILVGSRKNT
jgi:hypothetical protein